MPQTTCAAWKSLPPLPSATRALRWLARKHGWAQRERGSSANLSPLPWSRRLERKSQRSRSCIISKPKHKCMLTVEFTTALCQHQCHLNCCVFSILWAFPHFTHRLTTAQHTMPGFRLQRAAQHSQPVHHHLHSTLNSPCRTRLSLLQYYNNRIQIIVCLFLFLAT